MALAVLHDVVYGYEESERCGVGCWSRQKPGRNHDPQVTKGYSSRSDVLAFGGISEALSQLQRIDKIRTISRHFHGYPASHLATFGEISLFERGIRLRCQVTVATSYKSTREVRAISKLLHPLKLRSIFPLNSPPVAQHEDMTIICGNREWKSGCEFVYAE